MPPAAEAVLGDAPRTPAERSRVLTEALEHLERVETLVEQIRDSRDEPDALGDAMLEPLLEQAAQLTEHIAERFALGDAQFDGQERPLWVEMVRTSWSRIIAHVGEQVIEGSEGDLLDIIRFVVDLIEKQL